jgi:hypothetical protein
VGASVGRLAPGAANKHNQIKKNGARLTTASGFPTAMANIKAARKSYPLTGMILLVLAPFIVVISK